MAFLLFSAITIISLAAPAAAHAPEPLSPLQRRSLNQARALCSRDVNCILAKEAVEGPYYVEHPLIRSNITETRTGVSMNLTITLVNVRNCAPVPNAYVDIWHADASGEYSGWASQAELERRSPPPSPPLLSERGIPVESSRWLRGVQPSDEQGLTTFTTVFPGWYPGRSTHIHLRVHMGSVSEDHGVFLGSANTSHTGQLFFSDALVTEISQKQEPYATHRKTLAPVLNGDDGIFRDSNGGDQIVTIVKNNNGFFAGSVTVGIDPTSNQTAVDRGRPPPASTTAGGQPPSSSTTSEGLRLAVQQNWIWVILALIVAGVAYGSGEDGVRYGGNQIQ